MDFHYSHTQQRHLSCLFRRCFLWVSDFTADQLFNANWSRWSFASFLCYFVVSLLFRYIFFPQTIISLSFKSLFICVRICRLWLWALVPGEGDVAARHLLQVVDRRRLATEAVVGVVVGHDGGGPQLAQLAVRTLQLQLDGLQLRVFAPVHWREEEEEEEAKKGGISIGCWCIGNFRNKQNLEPSWECCSQSTEIFPVLFLRRATCTKVIF